MLSFSPGVFGILDKSLALSLTPKAVTADRDETQSYFQFKIKVGFSCVTSDLWVWASSCESVSGWGRTERESRRNRNAGLNRECWIPRHLEELHPTSSRSDQPCMHKTHPPKCPSTSTMTLILMGCPLNVKPITHTLPAILSTAPACCIWLMIVNTYTCFPSSSLYGEILKCRRLAAGKWTQ